MHAEHKNVGTFLLIFFILLFSLSASFFPSSLYLSQKVYVKGELEDLRSILFDLVPARYARQLMLGCSCIPCTPGRVVTLQLDLANFTVMSQSMSRFLVFAF